MASSDDIEIKIKTAIDDAGSAKSLQDLKKSMRELQGLTLQVGEGSDSFKKLNQAVANGREKIDDLNKSVSTLRGSGIEKLSSSFGVLKEGVAGLDPGKLSIGMKGLGAAMSAIPIFLIIEGIKFLIEKFDDLKGSGGFLGKMFTAIGDTITFVTDKIKQLSDWLGLTSFAAKKMSEDLIKGQQSLAESYKSTYDIQIRLAKAAHKDTEELEIKKQQAVIQTSNVIIAELERRQKAGQKLSDDDKKLLDESQKAILEAQLSIVEIHSKSEDERLKKTEEANQKAIEKRKKHEEELAKLKSDRLKLEDDLAKAALAEQVKNDAQELKNTDDLITKVRKLREAEELRLASSEQEKLDIQKERDMAAIEAEYAKSNLSIEAYQAKTDALALIDNKYYDDSNNLRIKADADKDASNKKELEATKKLASDKRATELDIASKTVAGLQSLSDLYFAVKSANLRKGSAEELKAAKQQFKINKALSLANAVISGIQGTIAAFSSGAAVPVVGVVLGPLYAIVAAAAAAANIAKIAGTQFEGGTPPSAVSPGAAPTVGAGASPASGPAINANPGGQFDMGSIGKASSNPNPGQNQNGSQRVYVVETDITNTQNKVNVIQQHALIG